MTTGADAATPAPPCGGEGRGGRYGRGIRLESAGGGRSGAAAENATGAKHRNASKNTQVYKGHSLPTLGKILLIALPVLLEDKSQALLTHYSPKYLA